MTDDSRLPRHRVALAWATHIFTLTGALWACLAVVALFENDIKLMWLWLGIALIVDGVDGTFARWAQVKTYAPGFDGTALDLIVDYLTWTFIPAVFIYLHVDFGGPRIGLAAMVLITVSSLFCYCNVALKTSDHYFMGFPAAWNVVAVIMWIFELSPVTNIIVTIALAILTVAPLTFVHPFRVERLRPVNIVAASAWVFATAGLVALYPVSPLWVTIVWWISGGWIMAISAWRTVKQLHKRHKSAGAYAPA